MRTVLLAAALALVAMTPTRAADIVGAKDHPLVGRYQGSSITFYDEAAYDSQRLLNHPLNATTAERLDDTNSMTVEWHVFRIRYDAPLDRSNLEIMRNYEDSLRNKGFDILYRCENEECLSGDSGFYRFGIAVDDVNMNYRYQNALRYTLAKLARPQGDVYAAVAVGGNTGSVVRVTVVETRPMETDRIAFVDAGQMASAIQTSGRVALYGIFFDTDKAEIKPESKPTLDEIAKFLKANPTINVVVAGHTDSQGAYDYNVALSRRRAQAVVSALTGEYGITASRLTPFGVGMAAPVASNDDATGRAKNRRVELVKR